MGVDFLVCKCCGDTFPDCGHFVGCECGEHWCCKCCAEADGYRIDEEENDEYEAITTCNFCRGEDAEDWELLGFALELLNIDRYELIERYKNK